MDLTCDLRAPDCIEGVKGEGNRTPLSCRNSAEEGEGNAERSCEKKKKIERESAEQHAVEFLSWSVPAAGTGQGRGERAEREGARKEERRALHGR